MFKKESFLRMAETRGEWCVSIYMNIDRIDPQKNRARMKRLTANAEKKLLNLGTMPIIAEKVLNPINMILDNKEFWKHRKEGFATFFRADSFVWHSLQYPFDDLVVVTDRFHLKPLLRNASRNRRFHLLSLSHKKLKFFEGTEHEIKEVMLKGMPRNMTGILSAEDVKNQLKIASVGKKKAAAEGIEELDETKKTKILDFFERVDKAITANLKDDDSSLLLAGPDFLHPIYRKANNCPNILKGSIKGDVDKVSPSELLERALPIVKPAFRREREDATEIFQDKVGTELASDKFTDIFKAANEGRVETLFVPVGKQQWGVFDKKSNKIKVHKKERPGDKDLLCVTSTRTLLNGGKVFVVLPEQMPKKSSIAAILRD